MSLNRRLGNSEIGGCKEIRQPFANPSPTLRQPLANLSPTLCQPLLPTPLQPPFSQRHGLTASWFREEPPACRKNSRNVSDSDGEDLDADPVNRTRRSPAALQCNQSIVRWVCSSSQKSSGRSGVAPANQTKERAKTKSS